MKRDTGILIHMTATIALCNRHHVVLCDQLPDSVLDALHIPASDSGDYKHVSQAECTVCASAEGLWHVDMSSEIERTRSRGFWRIGDADDSR